MSEIDDVLRFWFKETSPASWWKTDPTFDEEIRRRFAPLHVRASQGELATWRVTPTGRLAEVIVLDQFSRNLFRESARAYAQDLAALGLAQDAVAAGAHSAPERGPGAPIDRRGSRVPQTAGIVVLRQRTPAFVRLLLPTTPVALDSAATERSIRAIRIL